MTVVTYNRTFSPAEIDTVRSNFYQNPVVPTLLVDGTDKVFESNINAYESTFTSHIRVAQSIVPIFNLHLEAQATTTIGDLEVKIVAADTVPNNTILAFVAVCQDSIPGLARTFDHVCQKLYSFRVYLSYADSLDTVINFTHSMPVDKMTGILFIQDINTKKVLQATKTKFTEVK